MLIVPYRAEHLDELVLQWAQAPSGVWFTREQALALEGTEAWSGIYDNEPVICSGVVQVWQGRYMAWSYVSKNAGICFVSIHKAVRRFLDTSGHRRIEMAVDCDFPQGHRWARLLGFTLEAERLKAYRPDGGDCALYARVRG